MAADAVIWHNQCLVQTPVSTWDTSVFQETSVYWETGVFLGHWCLSGSPAQKEVSGRQCPVSVDRVPLIVASWHPGWEEMENFRGNGRKSGIDESQKSKFESRKRNLKF